MLLALLGCSSILVISSAALPMWNPRQTTSLRVSQPTSSQYLYRPRRHPRDQEEKLEPWVPNGVPGHIDLMASSTSNQTATSHLYDPYTTIQSIPNKQPSSKIAEIGYNKPTVLASASLNAIPFGWGTKFWMLKSHDVDCFAGSEFASSYNTSSQTGGTEYPVTLRSPLGNDKGDETFAYCATYDPNPQGSGMTLGAAPCGTISCAPLPHAKPGAKSFSSVSRNPDGTFAPTFFSTRPCNYLDSSCHVSQIFLYNAETGAVRPMYHTRGMEGVNSTWISSGQPRRRNAPEPLFRSVEMVFRVGDTRALPGWPDPDPTLVVSDPVFDVRNSSPASGSNATLAKYQSDVPMAPSLTEASAGVDSGTTLGTMDASTDVLSTRTFGPLTVASVPQSTPTSTIYLVWLAPPTGTSR